MLVLVYIFWIPMHELRRLQAKMMNSGVERVDLSEVWEAVDIHGGLESTHRAENCFGLRVFRSPKGQPIENVMKVVSDPPKRYPQQIVSKVYMNQQPQGAAEGRVFIFIYSN